MATAPGALPSRPRPLARDRLPAVAVDGKTCRGARRADGTRVHLLGAAEHGGHLLDHLEVDAKHNETSHFTALLEPLDLDGVVVTFDALHTVRANLNWLAREKQARYIAVVIILSFCVSRGCDLRRPVVDSVLDGMAGA